MRQEHDMLKRREDPPVGYPVVNEFTKLEPRRRFRLGVLVGAVATIAAALLVIQNSHSSDFEWLTFNFEAPLWLLLLLSLVTGAVVGETGRFLLTRSRSRAVERRDARGALRLVNGTKS